MKTQTSNNIISYIEQQNLATVQDIIREFDLSPQIIHRHLKKLIEQGHLKKIGSAPKVVYEYVDVNSINSKSVHNDNIIENEFVQIMATGKVEFGMIAFENWCKSRNFEIDKYIAIYHKIRDLYNVYKNNLEFIDATKKACDTFGDEMSLKYFFYLEFSAYEIFGKSKMYNYLLYSKLNQDTKMMRDLFVQYKLKNKITDIIKEYNIDSICFVPPTVPRKRQFMTELKNYLNIDLNEIQVTKLKTEVVVPQKTLTTTKDRIINSKTTFMVNKVASTTKNILIVDDFAGTGATINYIAQKMLQKSKQFNEHKTLNIIGLAICGTPNGVIDNSKKFEIVKEV